MKKNIPGHNAPFKYFCVFGLLLFTQGVFAAIPIQGASLYGAGAARARLAILAAAESCLGTPYRYAGIDRKGLDCSGLVYLSFKEALNYTIPRSSGGIYSWAEKIPDSELQAGDLVFFVTTGPGVSHLGIYAGGGRFIHSASEGPHTGVIYSRLDESYWKRTYKGAGRALPWDGEAARAMALAVPAANPGNQVAAGQVAAGRAGAAGQPSGRTADSVSTNDLYTMYQDGGKSSGSGNPGPAWEEPGYYVGFGAAWNWGGFIQGSPSLFRGVSTLAAAGYKGGTYRVGVELRPGWDRALEVVRLPLTISAGTDIFQVFGGLAYTFGDPGLRLSDGKRHYSGGDTWRWEAGFSAALPPMRISRGALSFYGELAWQPYHWTDGEDFSFKPDITANLRVSTGVRYLWRLGS